MAFLSEQGLEIVWAAANAKFAKKDETLSINGGNINGLLKVIRDDTNYGALAIGRTKNENNYELYQTIADNNLGLFSYKVNGEEKNYLIFKEEETILGKPLSIGSGGTGASDAATARANLGITPANIGAATTAQYNSLSSLVGNTAVSTQISDYAPSKTGSGASGTWGINISGSAGSATKATQDGSGNTITSTYCKLSGDNLMSTSANANLTASDVSGAWLKDDHFGLCTIGRGNGDGATLGTSGVANIFIKSWYGVGFVDMQGNKGVSVAINCRTGNVAAASFSGSGANLTSLNAGKISSGTLAIERGGTGATTAAAANAKLTVGTHNTATEVASLPKGITITELPATAVSAGDPQYGAMLTAYLNSTRGFQLGSINNGELHFRTIHTNHANGYSSWFKLLSTKEAVKIAEGGTGSTSALGARQNLRIFYGTTAERDAHTAIAGDIWVLTD